MHFYFHRFCANSRLSFLTRCLPPALTSNTDQKLDTEISANIASYGGAPADLPNSDPAAFDRICRIHALPTKAGGFGLTPQHVTKDTAFYRSTAYFLSWYTRSPLARHPLSPDLSQLQHQPGSLMHTFTQAHSYILSHGAQLHDPNAPPVPAVALESRMTALPNSLVLTPSSIPPIQPRPSPRNVTLPASFSLILFNLPQISPLKSKPSSPTSQL